MTRQVAPRPFAVLLCATLMLLSAQASAQRGVIPTAQCERSSDETATLTTEVPPGLTEADIERTQWASRTTGGWSNAYESGAATTYQATVRSGLEAEGRVRFQTQEGWTGWSDVVGCAAAPLPLLTDHDLLLIVGEHHIPLDHVALGPFRSALANTTAEELSIDAMAELPGACTPGSSTWRANRYYDPEEIYDAGDLSLKDLFAVYAAGARDMSNTGDTASLKFLDDDEARRINFFGFVPLHYESINLDSLNPGQAAVEVMEFSVARCEYA